MNNSPFLVPSAVIGLALILSAVVGSHTFYAVHALDNTLSVTGSAKVSATADSAKWTIAANRIVPVEGVSGAYAAVAADTAAIKTYLKEGGVTDEQITVSPIFVDEYWSSDQVRRMNVRQDVTVASKDVKQIEALANNTVVLAQRSVQFSPRPPEYFISNLPELRVSLLKDAVNDAAARASQIASATGQSVGKLKSAASGVVQVLQPNSIDVADYGQYDTSTVEKDVMVTVRTTFLVQ